MKHDMRTLIFLLILGFLSEARKPSSERRPSTATHGREKRSPFGYVVRGPNHVAAFQMGSLEDGLLGQFPRFTSNGFQRSGAFIANSLSNFFNNLVDPSPSRSLGKPRQPVQTQKPPGRSPLLFSAQGPALGEKGAPVFPQGNVIVPRFGTVPSPPPPPVHVLPPVNLAPSIRSPEPTTRRSTQYFVLGDSAPELTNLYNHPALPTVNPLHPFSRSFHNYPTIVTLGHSNPGVLPTLNPSKAFPTLNPPFYTNNFATFAVSQIQPTRTFLQPTFAPLPPSPPLAPPLPPPSFPSVIRPAIPRPVATLPKGTFFWFKLNNENVTFSPNYNEFMKSYQNPLFFTRPMQNSFFRPFFTSGNRAFLCPSVNRVSTTNRLPGYVPNYFPAHFPLNIPFLKAEDEHPAEGHPGKHTTIYHGPAGVPTPTPTVSVPESTTTPETETEQTSNPDETTPESPVDTAASPEENGDSDPVTESNEDPSGSTESGREIDESDVIPEVPRDEPIDSSTESPDERKEPAYKGFVPATKAPRPFVPEADEEDGQTREPTATVIPFDTSTTSDGDAPSRPRSFDQSSNDRDSNDGETTTKGLNEDFDDDMSAVRRTGKSARDSNDYEQLFVDFMSSPNSIDGAGKSESGMSTTEKTELDEPAETTTAGTTTTTPSTTTVRFDEFDHFVDIFEAEKPAQEETTTSVTSTVTTASTTTELEPETTPAPETTTTTTAKPKFKLTTKSRPRLTSVRTTPKPKVRPTIKFKSRLTTPKTKVKITEPTTAKPSTTTTEAETTTTEAATTTTEATTTTTTEATTTTTEVTTTTTEATTTTTEATTTTTEATTTTTEVAVTTTEDETTTTETISASTDSIATEDSTTTEPTTKTPTESATDSTTQQEGGNSEESTEKTAVDEGIMFFANPAVTPEREELPTTVAMEELPVTTEEPITTESPAMTVIPEVTTVGEMSTATTEAATTIAQTSLSEDAPDKSPMGSDDETTTAQPQAEEPVEDAVETTTIATKERASSPDESAAMNESQAPVPATESPTTPRESDDSAGDSDIKVEVSMTAAPPEADDSRKESGLDDDSSTKGQVADDEEATTATTEPATTEQPRMNNRKSKKLENDDSTSSNPTSAMPVDVTPSADQGSSTDEITEVTTSPTTTPEEPTTITTIESNTTTDPTEPTTEENPEPTTSETASSTDSEVTPPDLGERPERIPETVLVGGRNYSDVQDNHPVVTDIETSENNKKVRRAATWFVWLLDREKIAKNLVNDVSDFASSRNIIYVVTAALLISSMLSLMGLYCTLRSKK